MSLGRTTVVLQWPDLGITRWMRRLNLDSSNIPIRLLPFEITQYQSNQKGNCQRECVLEGESSSKSFTTDTTHRVGYLQLCY